MDKNMIAKFECRAERNEFNNSKTTMFVFYNERCIDGFKRLVVEQGIIPETYDDNSVCSIGKIYCWRQSKKR